MSKGKLLWGYYYSQLLTTAWALFFLPQAITNKWIYHHGNAVSSYPDNVIKFLCASVVVLSFAGLAIFGSLLLLLLIVVEAAPPTSSAVPLLGKIFEDYEYA